MNDVETDACVRRGEDGYKSSRSIRAWRVEDIILSQDNTREEQKLDFCVNERVDW